MDSSSEVSSFGDRLSKALEEKGMSQAHLARLVNVNPKTIERYAGRENPPSLNRSDVKSTMMAIAEELDVRREWLVEGTGSMSLSSTADLGSTGSFPDPLRRARESIGLSPGQAVQHLKKHGMEITEQDLLALEKKEEGNSELRDYGTAVHLLTRAGKGPLRVDLEDEMQRVPQVRPTADGEIQLGVREGGLVLPKTYIRQRYGIAPGRVVVVRVRGDSMVDTLRPGQVVVAARWNEGESLEDGAVYGLKGPHGFSLERIRFDRSKGDPVIWIWADSERYADQRRRFGLEEFEQEYSVVLIALGVEKQL